MLASNQLVPCKSYKTELVSDGYEYTVVEFLGSQVLAVGVGRQVGLVRSFG